MVRKARKEGVKIVNLSLGFPRLEFNVPYNRAWDQARSEFQKVIEENNDILFVASAGNASSVIDFNLEATNFPCGLNLPNVICTGSVNKDNEVSNFSNVVKNHRNIIYARGEDLDSIVPSKYCRVTSSNSVFEMALTAEPSRFWEDLLDNILSNLKRDCERKSEPVAGTSFSAPIVSRESAKIWMDNPHFTPEQVITELFFRSETVRTNTNKEISVLPFEIPRWLD